MKRYEVKFKIDLRDSTNPEWLKDFVRDIGFYDRMFGDESIVADSTEVNEVPIS